MTRKALVLVTTSFPIAADGSEAAGSFVSDIAMELARHRPVRVVAPGARSGRERWQRDIEVFRYAAPAQALSTLQPWRPADLLRIASVLKAGQAATSEATAAGPTAHLLALWALPCGHWARAASQKKGVPYSVWTLGSDIWTLGRVPLVRRHLRTVLREASTCFSDGLQLAQDTAAIAGRAVAFLPSVRAIGTGSGAIEPPRANAPYRLLFLGRWHRNKGIDLLLEALASLEAAGWEAIEEVRILGGGPMDAEVRGRVAALQAAGRPVHVGGYVAKPAAEAAILASDWVLIPSRIESIPVVFSDAMQLRRPVLASPVGDLPRLIGEGVGMCARDASVQGWVEALRHLRTLDAASHAPQLEAMAARFDLAGTSRTILDAIGHD